MCQPDNQIRNYKRFRGSMCISTARDSYVRTEPNLTWVVWLRPGSAVAVLKLNQTTGIRQHHWPDLQCSHVISGACKIDAPRGPRHMTDPQEWSSNDHELDIIIHNPDRHRAGHCVKASSSGVY